MTTTSTAIIKYEPSFDVSHIVSTLKRIQDAAVERIITQLFRGGLSCKTTILCIEIGHTRFKATNLTIPMNPKDLKNIKTTADRSAPYLKQDFLSLFKHSVVAALFDQGPNMVSLSLFGPIFDHSYHAFWRKNGFPENLKEALEKETRRPVMIDGDAVSWAIGALEYLKLLQTELTFPCLAITLGTGIGVALIENSEEIKAIEIWIMNPPYPRLNQFSASSLSPLRSPRQLLEKAFLDNLASGEEFIDEKMKTYRPTYNQHLHAFIEDACEEIEEKLALPKMGSILIGGGYSRFIDDFTCDSKKNLCA